MPYRITWNPKYVVFEDLGIVTSEDIIESNKQVYGDERFDELSWELVSFDEADSVSFIPSNIRLVAYMDKAAARSNPKITVAFVGESQILEDIEKAYADVLAHTSWPVIRFDSADEAVAYITQAER